MRAPWARWLLFALAAQLSACSLRGCSAERPIVKVNFERAPGEQLDFSDEALHTPTAALMKALPGFSFRQAEPGTRGWVLSVILALGQRPAEGEPGAVGLRLELRALGPADGPSELSGAALERGPGPQLALAQAALTKAGEALADAIELSTAPEEAVAEAIKEREGEAQLRAIRAAAKRQLKAATPALSALLQTPALPDSTLLKIVGAMTQIRDPRAAGPLISTARGRSPIYLRQVIFALARIGGPEAEGYLFTAASGHQDPAIRDAAKQALKELSEARGAAPEAR